MRALGMSVLLVAAALAGCVNDAFQAIGGKDEPVPSERGGDGLAPGELLDRSTPGQVKGVVTNLALDPLPGANVTILSLNRTLVTAVDGSYHFVDLANGRVLLFAQALGYHGKTQSATIRNGTVVTLDFRLEPLPVVEPYAETMEFGGLIACDGLVKGVEGEQEVHCGTADPNDKRVFESPIARDAKTLVVEVRWEARSPTAQALRARIETVGFGAADAVLANTSGRSVLRLEVPSPALEKYYPQGGTVRVVVAPAPSVTGDEAGTDVAFAFQQSFSVYLTAFYHESAPAGFSVLGDG